MKRATRRGLFRTGIHDENHARLVTLLSTIGPEPIDTTKVGAGFPDEKPAPAKSKKKTKAA